MAATDARTRARLDRARSGASGTHADRRTRRVRDRSGAKRAALRDQRA